MRSRHLLRLSKAAPRLFSSIGLAGACWLGATDLVAATEPLKFRNQAPTPPPPVLDPPEAGSSIRTAPTGLDNVTTIPNGGYQNEPIGLRQSTFFRNTRLPYGQPFELPPVDPSVRTESVRAHVQVKLPALTGGIPLFRNGFDPQDADLKVGPLFIKIGAFQAAVLHSDNINLTDKDRKSGTIAIASIGVGLIAQITEGLRITTAGSFTYLPIEGRAGISGFGLSDLYAFGIYEDPAIRAQITWDTNIGYWPVTFSDEFIVGLGYYSDDFRNDYALFDGGQFDDESRKGRYVFRPSSTNSYDDRNRNRYRDDGFDDYRNDLIVYSNTVSAETERLLPGTVRLRARVYHENLWYNQGNRGLPDLREGATVSLASERENMRFKPYIIYEALRTDSENGFDHTFRLGITGPITDQIYLRAEGGYYITDEGNTGTLWQVELKHIIGPYTEHAAFYSRSWSEFHDEIVEGLGYNIHQVLGPKLNADAYVMRLHYDDPDRDGGRFERTELRAGLRLSLAAGPKTSLQASATYASIDANDSEAWTLRMEAGYNFTDTLQGRFLYQYQQVESNSSEQNYVENLFFLSMTKYFR